MLNNSIHIKWIRFSFVNRSKCKYFVAHAHQHNNLFVFVKHKEKNIQRNTNVFVPVCKWRKSLFFSSKNPCMTNAMQKVYIFLQIIFCKLLTQRHLYVVFILILLHTLLLFFFSFHFDDVTRRIVWLSNHVYRSPNQNNW